MIIAVKTRAFQKLIGGTTIKLQLIFVQTIKLQLIFEQTIKFQLIEINWQQESHRHHHNLQRLQLDFHFL